MNKQEIEMALRFFKGLMEGGRCPDEDCETCDAQEIAIEILEQYLTHELVHINKIVEFMMSEFDETPCNINNYDDYAFDNYQEWCEEHCGDDNFKECWKRLLLSKFKEVSHE